MLTTIAAGIIAPIATAFGFVGLLCWLGMRAIDRTAYLDTKLHRPSASQSPVTRKAGRGQQSEN